MAEQGTSQGMQSGPGNRRIATTFLESLAVHGEASAGKRARRALELAGGGLDDAKAWLPEAALGRMFAAADTELWVARSVGHRVMAPDAIGFSLYRLGLATPEKAYRRVQALLPRDCAEACWSVTEMARGSARIEYHTAPVDADGVDAARPRACSERGEAALCALRKGMLEAVPGLFGLLPARVEESTCRAEGADACRYVIRWERQTMFGLAMGGGLGLAVAVGFLVLVPSVFSISTAAFLALTSFGMAVAMGRSFDLHQQLDAVAGARRGHLALYDQVDDALASKLDALARVDAKFAEEESLPRAANLRPDPGDTEILPIAWKIHAAAGDLECWFEDRAPAETDGRDEDMDAGRALVRKIRAWAGKIAEVGAGDPSPPRESVDLVVLVRRAIAAARPLLPSSTLIKLEHDDEPIPIACEPVQIEQIVVQLLRNAVDATRNLHDSPEVIVSLRRMSGGVELAVEDRGVGIEPSLLDEVFDPFFKERRVGIDEGFGLPVCLRIVERHGGELRIEAGDRPGTRVSVLLPESAAADR